MKLGINFFDVSPYYGRTKAETVLGKALRDIPRDHYVLATKVGRYDVDKFDFSAETVTTSVNESMSRLGVDKLDIVYCHDVEFVDLDIVVNQALPALNKLKNEGKIKAVGVTGYPMEVFPYLLSQVSPGTIEVVLSYCNHTLQNQRLVNLLPLFKQHSVGVVNASPLSMGLLTGAAAPSWHPASDLVKKKSMEAGEICRRKGSSLAAVALQYALGLESEAIASTLVGIDSRAILAKNIATMMSKPDKVLENEVLKIFEPVLNETWDSGRFRGSLWTPDSTAS